MTNFRAADWDALTTVAYFMYGVTVLNGGINPAQAQMCIQKLCEYPGVNVERAQSSLGQAAQMTHSLMTKNDIITQEGLKQWQDSISFFVSDLEKKTDLDFRKAILNDISAVAQASGQPSEQAARFIINIFKAWGVGPT